MAKIIFAKYFRLSIGAFCNNPIAKYQLNPWIERNI